MDNLFTYLKFRGDLSFKQFPFNEVDGMIFSLLSGLDYEGVLEGRMPIKKLVEKYRECGLKDDEDERYHEKEKVLFDCADSIRYGSLEFDNYVKTIDEESETTFYAVTIYASKFDAYVCYRGTDGTLLSWKENFTSLYEMPTKGQYEAVKYLTALCKKPFVRICPLGHSKGGNLALYASSMIDTRLQKKINTVYIFDAPGFIEDISNRLGFLNVKDRIKAYIPVSCVIGNLMNVPVERTVVNGEGVGVYQHDIFYWMVEKDGVSVVEDTNEFSKELSAKVNGWIDGLPMEDRKRVVDELFNVFIKNDIYHITGLMHMDFKKILGILRSLTTLSSENRELLGIIIKQLRVKS